MSRIAGRRGRLYAGIASGGTAVAIGVATGCPVIWSMSVSICSTIDFTVAFLDVTSLGDTNHVYVAGLPDASGAFTGFYDNVGTAQLYTAARDGLARNMYLYSDNTQLTDYWYGTALFDFGAKGGVNTAVECQGKWRAASAFYNPLRGA